MKSYAWLMICLLLGVSLSGCGGGGGGGSSATDVAAVVFQNWSSIDPPQAVPIAGMSLDATYMANEIPPPAYLLDYKGISTSSSATISYRADGTIDRVDVTTPYGMLTWDEANGAIINEGTQWLYAIDAPQSMLTVASYPVHPLVDWEYQTYGSWATGLSNADGKLGVNGTIGAISIGAPTLASAIPTTGGVTFSGNSSGLFIDAAGDDYFAYSTLSAGVNFLTRYITINTTDTMKIPVQDLLTGGPTSLPVDAPNLDLSGAFYYSAGANSFSGDLKSSTAAGLAEPLGLEGPTTGRFYGPNAEELGGVFILSNPSDPTSSLLYYGGYGAVQDP